MGNHHYDSVVGPVCDTGEIPLYKRYLHSGTHKKRTALQLNISNSYNFIRMKTILLFVSLVLFIKSILESEYER